MGCCFKRQKEELVSFNVFQKIISKGRKPNNTWVNQGREFYNNLLKIFLKINNI